MPRLSNTVLNTMGQAGQGAGLFTVGQQLGGLGAKKRARDLRQSNAAEIAAAGTEAEKLEVTARQLEEAGQTEAAARLRRTASTLLEADAKKAQEAEEKAGTDLYYKSTLQELIASSEDDATKRRASMLLAAGERGGGYSQLAEQINSLTSSNLTLKDRYVPVGSKVFDKQAGGFVADASGSGERATMLEVIESLGNMYTAESIRAAYNPQTGEFDPDKPLISVDEAKDARESAEAKEVDDRWRQSQIGAIDNMLDTANKALAAADESWAGPYDLTKYGPSTSARKLAGFVKTMQSKLAFDRLQEMRDNSKTGGALGQVSNIELDLLMSNLTALDPAAGDPVFKAQVETVIKQYEGLKKRLLRGGNEITEQDADFAKEIDGETYIQVAPGKWMKASDYEFKRDSSMGGE